MISDHSDHGASKEQTNPLWTRIRRFLWCTMIRMIWDHKSVFGFSQKKGTPWLHRLRFTLCTGQSFFNRMWRYFTSLIHSIIRPYEGYSILINRSLLSPPKKSTQETMPSWFTEFFQLTYYVTHSGACFRVPFNAPPNEPSKTTSSSAYLIVEPFGIR